MFGAEADQLLITLVASIAAAASFAAFALPFLNKSEKKEKFRSVIEKRRKDLFEESRSETFNKKKTKESETLSARQSLAMMYKVQQLTGKMGEKAREKTLQAGYRNPRAPFKYMIAKIVVPIFLFSIAMMFLSGVKKEMAPFTCQW